MLISESSQAAKYGGCFTADDTVLTFTGIRKPLSELHVGEQILAQDPVTKKLVFSEVILFLDYNPSERREFLRFKLKSGRTFAVTANHLVSMKDGRTVYAGSLKTGDTVLVSDDSDSLTEDSIEHVSAEWRNGVYAPLTKVGTVVVNDVVASCYASIDSQRLAHWVFLPLRLVWNVRLGVQRFWLLVNRPIAGWTMEIDEVSRKTPEVGVHWYAKMLYSTANYLIPDRLNRY